MSVNDLLQEALLLSPSSRASLVEKIVESIATDIDPSVERSHLDAVAARRQDAAAHPDHIISGDDVLQRARATITLDQLREEMRTWTLDSK
jgi:Putative addiction module component